MDPLQKELLEMICAICNVQDVDLNLIGPDDPLLGPESLLGIDSLDALEIAVTVQQQYGVRMDSENTSRVVMQSVARLADYIRENR